MTVLLGEAAPVGTISPMDVSTAVRALGDTRSAVRLAAAKALERLGSESDAALNSASFSQDPEVAIRARVLRGSIAQNGRRGRFLAALARVTIVGSRQEFSARLVSPEATTRRNAADELRMYMQQGQALKPIFEELCLDPDPGVAFTGAYVSLHLGSRAGIPVLERMIASPNMVERILAMEKLRADGTAEDGPIFAQGLKEDDSRLRNLAFQGAIAKGDARMIEPLLEAVLQDNVFKENVVTYFGQQPLATTADPALRGPILKRLLKDEDPGVRRNVVGALANVTVKGQNDKAPRLTDLARQALSDALSDKDKGVRDMASIRLCQMLSTEESPDLPPGGMEKLFATCFARKVSPPFGPAHKMLDRGKAIRPAVFAQAIANSELRGEAVRVLRKSVDVAALDSADLGAIAAVVTCDDAGVRDKIYETLLHARGPGRGAVVMHGLDDPNQVVRAKVERALPSCDAELALELLAIEPMEKRLTKLLDACEPRVLLLASARALDSRDELVSERALDRLKRRRDELSKLAAQETDPAVKAKLEEALKRSGR